MMRALDMTDPVFAFASGETDVRPRAPRAAAPAPSTDLARGAVPSVPELIVFDGCFGRLYLPAPMRALGRGVVLCNPFGHEALATGRSLRVLAGMLAEAGLPVLHFDYEGTGDSAGAPAPGQLGRWSRGIGDAAHWLRANGGVEEVFLCGLRLGALLALHAAPGLGSQIAGLALLAPPASGRALLREMTMQQAMLGADAGRAAGEAAEPMEFYGFPLFARDRAELAALDLAAQLRQLAGLRCAILGSREAPAGTVVDMLPFDGLGRMMRSAETAEVPHADFARLASWIAHGAAIPTRRAAPSVGHATLELPEAREHFIEFGDGRQVFGVLSTPRAPVAAGAPSVLILNTGTTPHIGHARLAVELSRRLAAAGIPALRIDARGLGDSRGPTLGPRTCAADARKTAAARAWRPEFDADMRAAIALLVRAAPAKVVLFGLCSGAGLAQLATLDDPRVAGAVLVNPPRLPGRMASDGPPLHAMADTMTRAITAAAWRWLGAANARRMARASARLGRAVRRRAALLAGHGVIGGLFNPALRALRHLARPGIPIRLIYDAGDPGLADMRCWLGDAPRLPVGDLSLGIVEGAGHVFAARQDRDRLFDELIGIASARQAS